jgi:hypothetical protein
MRSDTRAVTIRATPQEVVAYVGDPRHLPQWAIGFAKDVRQENGRWIVSTGQSEVPVAIEVNEDAGTVDFRMETGPGMEAVAYSRAVPNGDATEYSFTQFQQAGVSEDLFGQLANAVGHELVALKARLEVTCPL